MKHFTNFLDKRQGPKDGGSFCLDFGLGMEQVLQTPISKPTLPYSAPLSVKVYFNPQVRINKTVNEHKVDYHLYPSSLTSRIHPHIFQWTPWGFISLLSRIFIKFFLKPVHPTMVGKNFQACEQTFLLVLSEAKLSARFLSSISKTKGNYSFPQGAFFQNIFASPAERVWGRRNYKGGQKMDPF